MKHSSSEWIVSESQSVENSYIILQHLFWLEKAQNIMSFVQYYEVECDKDWWRSQQINKKPSKVDRWLTIDTRIKRYPWICVVDGTATSDIQVSDTSSLGSNRKFAIFNEIGRITLTLKMIIIYAVYQMISRSFDWMTYKKKRTKNLIINMNRKKAVRLVVS